jgi:hypothetical protein
MSRIVDARSFVTVPDWPREHATSQQREGHDQALGLYGSIVNEMTKSSDKPPYADTFSISPSGDYSPWPVGSGELASLVDLGLSDHQIARYFGVEQVKVSALRAYYGLFDSTPGPDVVMDLIPDDGSVASDGQC